MSGRSTRGLAIAMLPLLLLAALSVSVDLGYTVALVDVDGHPVPGAYVTFHREAHRLSLGRSVDEEPPLPARLRDVGVSDERGLVGVSPSVDLHWPFPLQSPATLVIDLVYAPSLHNGLVFASRSPADRPGTPTPSRSEISIELEDLATDPERWLRSLGNLHAVLGALDQEVGRAGSAASADTRARLAEMRDGAVVEYEAFQRRYRQTARTPPAVERTPPDVARTSPAQPRSPQSAAKPVPSRGRETTEQDLAMESTWGAVAERLYGPGRRER